MSEEDLLKKLRQLKIARKKWENRKSRASIVKFLLPSGINGFISVLFTLKALDITTLIVGGQISLVYNSGLIMLWCLMWLPPYLMIKRIDQKIKNTYRLFALGFP
jgi:hypothetical protein